MLSFKSNIVRGVAAPMGSDLTLMDLLTVGLVNWEGANLETKCPLDSMRFTATVAERLLSHLEVMEGQVNFIALANALVDVAQVASHTNALQLQALGLDMSVNTRVEDRQIVKMKIMSNPLVFWNRPIYHEDFILFDLGLQEESNKLHVHCPTRDNVLKV
ncbi:hypothetical protein BDM02DRAFT_3191814 [Thelephora ganbajun]|uniref:Uncharacterized protein n=1 Tax=Thelephora ganbajun TaxID=370292 RepID=A0ACB6Z0R6_THEGA|nr:hypothetical protein BDM02DRAFT_3191814 [Thelephora ganbajun]